MSLASYIVDELHVGVPAAEVFCHRFVIEPPQHAAVMVAAARLHYSDHLLQIGKSKGLPYVGASVNEPGSFHLGILVH